MLENALCSLRECVEVVGILSSVEHDQLEPTLCRILHHIRVNISGDKIETFHWLGKNSDKMIFKFWSTKYCEHRMRVKIDLKDLDVTDLDLPAGAELHINDIVCSYYRRLWNETKNLWNKKKNILILLLMELLGFGCKKRVHIVP